MSDINLGHNVKVQMALERGLNGVLRFYLQKKKNKRSSR